MNREKIAFAAMKPADLALGAVVSALRATGSLEKVTDPFYKLTGVLVRRMLARNDLTVEGTEHIPRDGGVIFAVNHQSWNDVQVVGATCPRRLRFLSKSEFETWPVLRHFIALTDSPFIRRGGDAEGMEQAIGALRDGKALVIFPEGTIPGEEDVMRHEVEPHTGLLRGHTGAVRLAIAAGVPIVPVGLSGTGAAMPPEVYPRLELLELPKPAPITVRYGMPVRYDGFNGTQPLREELRRLTDELMHTISTLVDHHRNFIPITVPIEPLPRYERLGVLLLHGFTSSLKTVDGLVPHLTRAGIPYRMPVLRGHGTHHRDLRGVTAQDWYADAEAALRDLRGEVDKVVIVGLSMGGLVALNLAIAHAEDVAWVVTVAAAMRFRDPLSPLSPLMAKVLKSWPSPNAFNDASLKSTSENYPKFATDAFVSLLNYAKETEKRLPQVRVPLCVLQSKKDQVVDPVAANLIYRDVSSTHREIHWFAESGHEMGQDLERDAVFECVMDYVRRFRADAKVVRVA